MQLIRLDTSLRRDVRKFIRFPFWLYRSSAVWVPPLLSSERYLLDRRRNHFYQHSAADFFLVEEHGRVLGRIAAFHNKPYNDYIGARQAAFGFFESIDDPAVSQRLFEAAFEWATGRGLDAMVGPGRLRPADATGALVEGFEHRPAMSVPYNPPYYDALIKAAGFEKESDHLSGYVPGTHELDPRFFEMAEKVKARHGLWVKTFASKDEMRQWVPRVAEVYQGAFGGNHGFYPLSDAEITEFADELIAIADPRLVKLVIKGEDDVVGFAFAYHDISAGLQQARGRLWPIGWYYLLRERKRTRWANLNGIGVLPAYQGRGASILLYTEVARTCKEFGFDHADVVAVGEDNLKSRAVLETAGVRWYKRHRNYIRTL